MSQSTLIQDDGTPSEKDKFQFVQFPIIPETATTTPASEIEVSLLRTKVECLELKLTELQSAMHVFRPSMRLGYLTGDRHYNGIVILNGRRHWKIGLLNG